MSILLKIADLFPNKKHRQRATTETGGSRAKPAPKESPPRPPLVLRVGVAGHRVTEKHAEPDLLRFRTAAREVFRQIADELDAVASLYPEVFSPPPARPRAGHVAAEGRAGTAHGDGQKSESGASSVAAPPRRGIVRVISSLAAGADQWLAATALELGCELQAVLPLTDHEYRQDFAGDEVSLAGYQELRRQATAIVELDGAVQYASGRRHVPDGTYAAAAGALLDQSDLLIAVWDGVLPTPTLAEAAHRDGTSASQLASAGHVERSGLAGTGATVHEALRRGIPVIWISWSQGTGPRRPWQVVESREDLCHDRDNLRATLRGLLLLPPQESHEHCERKESLLEAYLQETRTGGNALRGVWLSFRDAWTGEIKKLQKLKNWRTGAYFRRDDYQAEATKDLSKEPPDPEAEGTEPRGSAAPPRATPAAGGQAESPCSGTFFREPFLNHYAWANGLALHYGHMYRSSFIVCYMLGALAVFAALAPLIPKAWTSQEPRFPLSLLAEPLPLVVELVCIGGILWLIGYGQRQRWHERLMDYRTLAERIRVGRYLGLLGGGSQRAAIADHLLSYGNPDGTWMYWFYRAIERAAGLPCAAAPASGAPQPVVFDAPYLDFCKRIWCGVLIREQIDYHENNMERQEKIDRRLHHGAAFFFIATCVFCLGHLLLYCWSRLRGIENESPEFGLILLNALLPAIGAALTGIRSQGEFLRVARRSEAMVAKLKKLELELSEIPARTGEGNSQRLKHQASQIAQVMINETLDWRVMFLDRPLTLP